MSFKVGYPPPKPPITGNGSAVVGSYIQHVTLAAGNTEQTFAAGTFILSWSADDTSLPAVPITVTDPSGATEYSSLDCSAEGWAQDIAGYYCAVPTTFKFNNLTPASICSIQYYAHPR